MRINIGILIRNWSIWCWKYLGLSAHWERDRAPKVLQESVLGDIYSEWEILVLGKLSSGRNQKNGEIYRNIPDLHHTMTHHIYDRWEISNGRTVKESMKGLGNLMLHRNIQI